MAEVIVRSPVADFDGEVGAAAFRCGVATVDTSQVATLAYLIRRGYQVQEPDMTETEPDADPADQTNAEPPSRAPRRTRSPR